MVAGGLIWPAVGGEPFADSVASSEELSSDKAVRPELDVEPGQKMLRLFPFPQAKGNMSS